MTGRALAVFIWIFLLSELSASLTVAWILWGIRHKSYVARYVGIFLTALVLDQACQLVANLHRSPAIIYNPTFISWTLAGRIIRVLGAWFLLLSIVRVRQKS